VSAPCSVRLWVTCAAMESGKGKEVEANLQARCLRRQSMLSLCDHFHVVVLKMVLG
jgi:hypothetical protein